MVYSNRKDSFSSARKAFINGKSSYNKPKRKTK